MKKLFLFVAITLLSYTSLNATDYYWIDGSGDWTDYANHWATTSGGGTFHTQMPTQNDNVYFDANSFTAADQIVTINTNAVCADMDWTGSLFDPELAKDGSTRTLSIHGSLTFITDMNFNFLGTVYFESLSTGKTITSAGQSFKYHVYFNNVGGWILQDGFVQTGNYTVFLNSGTLDLNNMPLTVYNFNTRNTNVRTMIMGDSITTITSASGVAFTFRGENFTFDCGSSLIRFTGVNGGMDHYNYNGSGLTFYDVIFEAGTGSSTAKNELGSFNLLTFNSNGTVSGGNTIDSLTVAGTGTINSNSNNINVAEFNGNVTINSNGTYAEVSIDGNGLVTGSNTIGDLILTPGKSYTFDDADNQVLTGMLTANGTCALPITIQSDHASNQTTLTKTGGSVTIDYCLLKGMEAAGTATFTADNTLDMGNNSGWTITPPDSRDLYWIGGPGFWNDPTKWSESSGGSAVNCIPNALDDVFFDANSFSASGQTVTIVGDENNNAYCNNMNWTGADNPILAGASSQNLHVYGSLTLVSPMSYTFAGKVYFVATTTGNTIKTEGITLGNNEIYFDGPGGEWTLQDGLNTGTKTLNLISGSLVTDNYPLDVGIFHTYYENIRALTLGSSVMTISLGGNAFYFRGEDLTFNAGTSTIRFAGAHAYIDHHNYYGPGLTFNDVIFEAASGVSTAKNQSGTFNKLTFNSTGIVNGGNTIDTITFTGPGTINSAGNNINTTVFHSTGTINSDNTYGKVTMNGSGIITGTNTFDTLEFTAGNQYTLTNGKIQTIQDEFIAIGTDTQYIIIKSSSTGSESTFNKITAGNVTVDYVSLQDNHATGSVTFTANNSINLGNTTGWTINSPDSKDYYWVGDDGNFNDASEWSLTSGGPPGTGVPLLVDNVFFDANSFSAPGQTVTLIGDASNNVRVHDMDWTGADNPILAGASNQTLRIYGSLTFIPNMSYTFAGKVYFVATTTGKTITTAGVVLGNNNLYFDSENGEWTLSDGLDIGTKILYLINGSLITNNHPLDVGSFYTRYENTRALTLGSSVMTISLAGGSAFYFRGENLTFDAGTSTIRFTAAHASMDHYNHAGPGLTFNDVIFEAASGSSTAKNQSGAFNNLTFNSTGLVYGANTIDTVTFNGTGTINVSGNNINTTVFNATGTIHSDGTYGKVTMNGNGYITGTNTFDTLTFTAGNQYTITSGRKQIIQNELIAEGTETDIIVIKSSSAGSHATFEKTTPGDVTVNYVSLKDNHATGGTVTFTANNSVDLGNTTGWTIIASGPEDYYWVGGDGNYNDASEWSLTSGGASGAGVPTLNDDVFFDANSFSAPGQVVTIIGDASNIARAMNMDWTGATNNPVLAGASTESLYIYGSLTFIPDMSYTFAGPLYFAATETGKTITTAGITLGNNDIYFDGPGGEWILQDGLNIGAEILYLVNGSLITNNHPLDVGSFQTNYENTRALNLGSSVMTISSAIGNAFFFRGENFTFDAGTSNIRFTGAHADINHHNYYGPGLTFNDVIFEAASGSSTAKNQSGTFNNLTFNSTGIVSGGNTIDSVTFTGTGTINSAGNNFNTTVFNSTSTISGDGAYGKVTMKGDGNITGTNAFDTLVFTSGNTYTLTSGETQTINNTLVADGSCTSSIDIQASSSSPTTIEKATGTVTVRHCNLQWTSATGGATFNAENSIDLGNNSGWNFSLVPLELFWVGGSGNWDDMSHWAATSGGTGGYCLPTQSDNVFFDNNSFSMAGQAVNINVADAECKDMDWSMASFSPILTASAPSNNLKIHGSFTLIQNMNFAFTGAVYFEGQTPSPSYYITSAGKNFNNAVYFNGVGGIWTLQDDFSVSLNNLYLNHGTLNTNNYNLTVRRLYSTTDNTRELDMGSSVFTVGYNADKAWYVTGSNFSIVPGSSEIRFTSANAGFWSLGASALDYNHVKFQNGTGTSSLNSDDSFNAVTFNPLATISGGGTHGSVIMNLGGQIQDNSSYGSVKIYGNTTINGENSFSRLLLGPGATYIFEAGEIQTITGRFLIWGSAANPIVIHSSSAGTRATISKVAGTVLGNYIFLKDMEATGGATFNLYSSTDQGNNTGWNFLAPTYLDLPSTTITPGPEVCYEATETITVGGGGDTFIVQNGGSVKLIAGYRVHLLPGTWVHSGGYLNAYCTPYGFFCDTVSTMPSPPLDLSEEVTFNQLPVDLQEDSFFRIYPNPSDGVFTLELKDSEGSANIAIELTTLMGERIAKKDMPAFSTYQINLSERPPGIYLLKVRQNNKLDVKKLIKQ